MCLGGLLRGTDRIPTRTFVGIYVVFLTNNKIFRKRLGKRKAGIWWQQWFPEAEACCSVGQSAVTVENWLSSKDETKPELENDE